jgi:hypothetical protein
MSETQNYKTVQFDKVELMILLGAVNTEIRDCKDFGGEARYPHLWSILQSVKAKLEEADK